ncbi:MAG: hypothetical protein IPL61_37715 [Myxococcales bacterium]|nr:hypothetical protein [Myxococcales bacterium]
MHPSAIPSSLSSPPSRSSRSSRSSRARPGPLAVAALVALAATAACSSKDKDAPAAKASAGAAAKASAGPAGACDRREREHLCGEYHGAMAKPAWIKGECDAMKVPMVPACPAEGAVGRCARDVGTPQHTVTVFYPPLTAETGQAMCQGGQWTPS